MTKEEAIKILQDAYYTSILPDKGGIIFDALKLAVTALQSDPYAPDWSKAPDWANYCHKDSSNHWWWYECEPEKTTTYKPTIGRIQLAKVAHPIAAAENPIEKLFKRPDQ